MFFASYFNLVYTIPLVVIQNDNLCLTFSPYLYYYFRANSFSSALSHLLSNMYQEVARFSLQT